MNSSYQRLLATWLGLRVGGCLALSLHSSYKLGELSQWSNYDDSPINVVIGIIIIFALWCKEPKG